MRTRFFKKLTAISVPALVWVVWQCLLPLNQYTFRGWEALIAGHGWFAGFYPDQYLQMTEVGDLGPYTINAVPHPVEWETDDEGYRNSKDVCRDPKVVIVGDSTAMGASLTQKDTISEQLARDSHLCVRSMAGGKLHASMNRVYHDGFHPRWVVVVLMERNTHVVEELKDISTTPRWNWLDDVPHRLAVRWSHFRKNFYWSYRSAHGIAAAVHRSFVSSEEAVGIYAPRVLEKNPPRPEVLFLNQLGDNGDGPEQLAGLKNILNEFSHKIKTQGAELIVSFVPNKESVYYSLQGQAEPKLGSRIAEAFRGSDFTYVDLISRFKKEYAENHELLHQTDDSHWNEKGVGILSQMISSVIAAAK
jgi:hypothetical protein